MWLLSDHFLHDTNLIFSHIVKLFNIMITHGNSPDDFRLSTLIPIPKNKRNSINDSNNYIVQDFYDLMGTRVVQRPLSTLIPIPKNKRN